MIKVKDGVVFKAIPRSVIYVLFTLDTLSSEIRKDITITSANDSKHMKNSLHYKDLALDIRIRDLDESDIAYLFKQLGPSLGKGYDILLEKDHIHVEYDSKD